DGSLQEQGSGTWAGAAADGAGAGAADGVGTGDADGVGTGAAADGTGAGAGAANGVGTGGAGAGAANGDNGVISSNGDISSKGGIRGIGANVMLFATGDGNHSLAAAKMYWNSVKANLSEDEAAKHPARFAMAEIVNIHSEAMIFEPIHRVVFNTSFDTILEFADKFFKDRGVSYHESHSVNEYTPICESHSVNECRSTNNGCRFDFPILSKNRTGVITVEHPASGLPTAELQAFLDDFCMSPQNASAKLDYIHGEKELFRLCEEKYCVCFLLPPIDKRSIFQTVIHDGVLPRKAFSLGQPNEKRYYMESRLIRS
ncbi:MAG: DUF1015 domain-containing protein, partial [Oscillospiraceae bacterium]|nr:DUF1015 domain-containing protein [Oscillospiraceae bacterium]